MENPAGAPEAQSGRLQGARTAAELHRKQGEAARLLGENARKLPKATTRRRRNANNGEHEVATVRN